MIDPVIGSFTKQPSEVVTIGVDWTDRLGEGEVLSAVTADATDLASGAATPEVLQAYGLSGNTSYATVRDGTSGRTYKITLRVTTSTGQVYEADISMHVEEL